MADTEPPVMIAVDRSRLLHCRKASIESEAVKSPADSHRNVTKRLFNRALQRVRAAQLESARKAEDAERRRQKVDELSKEIR